MSATSVHLTQLSDRGVIRLYIGPMFAGKTSHAVYIATKMSYSNKVLFINWKGDVRQTAGGEPGKFSSHSPSNLKLADVITSRMVEQLGELEDQIVAHQVIVIDECQFYPDLLVTCKKWAFEYGKHLYIFGLDGDFMQRPIGQTLELIPYALSVEKMLGQCKFCLEELSQLGYSGGRDWCHSCCTARIECELGTPYRPDADSKPVLALKVGGAEAYVPVCGYHAYSI